MNVYGINVLLESTARPISIRRQVTISGISMEKKIAVCRI